MTFKPVDTAIVMTVGPCLDDTDMISLEEAIAHNAAGMDVSLIVEKTDGTTAVTAITLTTGGTSDWTHIDGGYYSIEITPAQNTEEGSGFVRGICDGVLAFESSRYDIVKANVYDSIIKGTDVLQTDVTQLAGVTQSLTDLKGIADHAYDPVGQRVDSNLQAIQYVTQSVTDFKDFVDNGYDPANNKIEGVKLVDTTTTNSDMRGAGGGGTCSWWDEDIKLAINFFKSFQSKFDEIMLKFDKISLNVAKINSDTSVNDSIITSNELTTLEINSIKDSVKLLSDEIQSLSKELKTTDLLLLSIADASSLEDFLDG